MEQGWGQGYSYNPYQPSRPEDRPGDSPIINSNQPQTHSQSPDDNSRRSNYPHHLQYLPQNSLPSISTYHHHPYPYPPYVPYPSTSSPTSLLSPYPQARQPPPHALPFESPRMIPDITGPGTAYSSSSGLPHISPSSPSNHILPPGTSSGLLQHSNTPSTATSSIYPPSHSAHTQPGRTATGKRSARSASIPSGSGESWDDEAGPSGSGKKALSGLVGNGGEYGDGLDEVTEEQPWGMPQHLYKDLNPKDKKQVRNKIGARRFRAKKKAHIQTLEQTNRALTIEIIQLRRANAILQSGYASSRASQGLSPSTLPETVVRRLTDDKGNVLMGVDVDMLEASFGGGDGNGLGLVVKDDAGWDK